MLWYFIIIIFRCVLHGVTKRILNLLPGISIKIALFVFKWTMMCVCVPNQFDCVCFVYFCESLKSNKCFCVFWRTYSGKKCERKCLILNAFESFFSRWIIPRVYDLRNKQMITQYWAQLWIGLSFERCHILPPTTDNNGVKQFLHPELAIFLPISRSHWNVIFSKRTCAMSV